MSILREMLKDYKPSAVSQGILEQKLIAAKEWLGSKWVFHKEYKYVERNRIYNKEDSDGKL